MKTISEHRHTALAYPCLKFKEHNSPKFFQRLPPPANKITIVLTVNVGLDGQEFFQGRELWMVSVVVWDEEIRRPVESIVWSPGQQAQLQYFARTWLEGVGQGDDKIEIGGIAYCVRRALTDVEIRKLPPDKRRASQ